MNIDEAIEFVAQSDSTDGNKPIFTGLQVIELLKKIDSNSKGYWINPKIALPKEDSYVLVTIQIPKREPKVRSSFYHKDFFMNDNGDVWKDSDREIKAWMYSPEPYKEGD